MLADVVSGLMNMISATIKAGKAPASLTAKNSPTKGTSNDGSSG